MSTPEVRLSPDGRDVAVNIAINLWKSTSSVALLADVHVREWTPLLPVSNKDGVA